MSFIDLWEEYGGKVEVSDDVPGNELWFVDKDGKRIATIINIGNS